MVVHKKINHSASLLLPVILIDIFGLLVGFQTMVLFTCSTKE